MKFAKRISIYIAIPTVLGVLLIWIMASLFASDIVNRNIKSQMADVVKSRSEIIESYIRTAEESLKTFSLGSQVRELLLSPGDAELQKSAQQYTKNYSDEKKIFEGIYIADTDTHVLTHTSEDVVGIYTRGDDTIDWFRSTVFVKDKLSNFGVMISPGTGNMVISMYYPVFEGENCIGYVGCAVYADQIMQVLGELTIDRLPNCRYILLDVETGLYIYNTRSELINTITDDKGCRELIDRVKAGEEIVGEYSYYDSDNARYLLSYSYIADRDWLFILKDSYGEVYNDVKIVRIVLGVVCLCIAVIILMVTYFFTRQTSRELMILEKSILRLGKLDISAADNLKKYVVCSVACDLSVCECTAYICSCAVLAYVFKVNITVGGLLTLTERSFVPSVSEIPAGICLDSDVSVVAVCCGNRHGNKCRNSHSCCGDRAENS